jgi:hypothetical protein
MCKEEEFYSKTTPFFLEADHEDGRKSGEISLASLLTEEIIMDYHLFCQGLIFYRIARDRWLK